MLTISFYVLCQHICDVCVNTLQLKVSKIGSFALLHITAKSFQNWKFCSLALEYCTYTGFHREKPWVSPTPIHNLDTNIPLDQLQRGFIKEFKIPKLLVEKKAGPGPSQLALFQALPSSVCIQYGSGRAANNGEGLGTLITWRGHKVDTKGGGMPNYKFEHNKPESEFLTG